jgi:hypothetical protein
MEPSGGSISAARAAAGARGRAGTSTRSTPCSGRGGASWRAARSACRAVTGVPAVSRAGARRHARASTRRTADTAPAAIAREGSPAHRSGRCAWPYTFPCRKSPRTPVRRLQRGTYRMCSRDPWLCASRRRPGNGSGARTRSLETERAFIPPDNESGPRRLRRGARAVGARLRRRAALSKPTPSPPPTDQAALRPARGQPGTTGATPRTGTAAAAAAPRASAPGSSYNRPPLPA